MRTHTEHRAPTGFGRALAVGGAAGVLGSIFMGAYLMGASFFADDGFFTPLHRIGSLLAPPDALVDSLGAAEAAEGAWQLSVGTALLGLTIHMITGAMYGAVFGGIVMLVKVSAPGVLELAGLAWGAIVFAVSAWVALPIAAVIFGVEELTDTSQAGLNPIADMAACAGWGTFAVGHLVFGLVVGLRVAGGRGRPAR